MPPYNTSSFSNTLDAADRPAQRKAVVAPFKEDFDGKIENVMQHIADFTHRCHETGVIEDFNFIIKENSPPPNIDMDDQKERLAWLSDPKRYEYGNFLIDSSSATLEKIQDARDRNREIVNKQTARPDPNKMPIVSKNLVSFQNRSWIYVLLQTVWTATMKAIMLKYQEVHQNNGVVLWYCFLRHFAGTTKENISRAYALLSENKLRLSNFNNNILKFTNFIRDPVCRLLKANQTPTYQQFTDIFHSAMEAPNNEFKAYVIALYTDYRNDGPTSNMTMLELLDQFDTEYTRLDNLGRWTKQEDHNMLALLSSFQTLQAQFNNLKAEHTALQAQHKPPPNGNRTKLNKPPPKKPNDPEVIEFDGYTWKWCEKCFNGNWNRTHVTSEHQPGKGRSKNRRQSPDQNDNAPPPPSNTPTRPQANVASISTPSETPTSSTATSSSFLDFI